jgi:PAS domain S-box-containing protein
MMIRQTGEYVVQGDPFKIVLLEEDPVDAELIRKILGYAAPQLDLLHVTTLQDAVREAPASDLLLFSLSREIKLDHLAKFRSVCNNTPVVVLASIDDTVVALKAVRQGAQEYLLKGQTSGILLIRTIRYAIERKKSEEALRYRLEFEKLIATISTHFINIPLDQIDRGLNRALQAIGEFAGVDRGYLFEFQGCFEALLNYEWCDEGIESQRERRRILAEREFLWLIQKLKQAEAIRIDDPNDLPPEAAAEKHEFEVAGIQSLICIPLIYGGQVVGCLGFEAVRTQKEWSDDIVSLLKMAGDMFVNALERKRAEWELQRVREMLTLYSRATNEVLWDRNLLTNEVWWNENLQHVYGHSSKKVPYQWWVDQLHPDDQQEMRAKVKNAIESGQTFLVHEYRFRCADGSYANVLDRGYLVFNEEKRPVRMVGALMKMSENKRPAEEFKIDPQSIPPPAV